MDIRFQRSSQEMSEMNTQQQRENFLIPNLMVKGTVQLTYTHYDRMIVGGVVPASSAIALPNEDELKAKYFLERRDC